MSRQRFGDDVEAILARHARAVAVADERCRAELAMTTSKARRGLPVDFVFHVRPLKASTTEIACGRVN